MPSKRGSNPQEDIFNVQQYQRIYCNVYARVCAYIGKAIKIGAKINILQRVENYYLFETAPVKENIFNAKLLNVFG